MEPQARPGDPCVLVIFGAAGDLTKRLLVPALYNLRRARLLPEEFAVIGVSRNEIDSETFRRDFGISLRESGNGEVVDGHLMPATVSQSAVVQLLRSGGRRRLSLHRDIRENHGVRCVRLMRADCEPD